MRYILLTVLMGIAGSLFGQGFTHQTGKYIQNKGAKIYYEEAGLKQGPVLLLLHGGAGTIEDFNSILPFLAPKYRIIAMDSRGHGKSTLGNESLSYALLQEDAEKILNSLQIDSCTILGFSDGGIVGYRLAASQKIRVNKLITVGSRWSESNNSANRRKAFQETTGDKLKQNAHRHYENYIKFNPEPDFNRFAQQLKNMWLDATATGHPDKSISQINCPTLIVRGDKDGFISLQNIAEASKLIKHATVFNIPFAGHNAFKDQPEIFKLIFNQFILPE